MKLPIRWGRWDEPVPAVDWLVDSLVPKSSVTILSAEPGSYKSYIVLELAVSVAEGRQALGRFETVKGRALYVDFDGGEDITRRRVAQLAPGRAIPAFGYLAGSEIGNVYDDLLWNALRDDAPELLVIDTLAAGSPGVDENDKRVGDVLIRARLLAQSKGTATVFLHHLNASGGVRGSTSLRGNPDCDFRAEKVDQHLIKVVCKKMKHAPDPPRLTVDVSGLQYGRGIKAE